MSSGVDDSFTIAPRRGRRGGYRVAMVLAVLALVPLVGLGVVTSAQLGEWSELRQSADEIESTTSRLVVLTELRASMNDEMTWAGILAAIRGLGLEVNIINEVVDIDAESEFRAASQAVDELALEAGLDDVADAVEDLRSSGLELVELIDSYEALGDRIDAIRVQQFDELRSLASRSGEALSLVNGEGVLELTSQARQGVANLFIGYLSARFGILIDSATATESLIRDRDHYVATTDAIVDGAAASPGVVADLDAIATSPEQTELRQVVDGLIVSVLVSGAPTEDLDLASLTVHIDELASFFVAWTDSSAAHVDLVEVAATDILTATETMRAGADSDAQRAIIVAAGLAAITVLLGACGTFLIVRPLRRLERAAEGLRDGRPVSLRPSGPIEVRAAADAINETAVHVDLATRQARALAAGDLEADALDESAPGDLGSALQTAVQTLTASLNEQDEFRRRLAHEAAHDGLTHLPNRTATMAQLTKSLARVSRSDNTLAVLFIDLDGFKEVNDHHGHHAGDVALKTVAERLVTAAREGDHVGRLGGDEFVVIAEPVRDLGAALQLGERILEELSEPIAIESTTVTVGASIGVALAEDAHLTADEILRDADLAVYKAKASGRGGLELCDEDLRSQIVEEADLARATRGAIDRDELRLYYQPIVSPGTGEIHALEALVRWQRPGYDDLFLPEQFIPFAERSALIIDIDRWVVQNAVRQLDSWTHNPVLGPYPVAINVSGRHLGTDQFVSHILEPFETHGVDPSRLVVELTETVLLDDLTSTVVKLQQLRDAGVQIAIDDFGTGYTSLAHLRSLPIDILKVDQSFTASAVHDQQNESVIKLIIDTGHLLGARIIAEGVETEAQAEKLDQLGSDNLQGFFFGKPRSPDEIEAAVAEGAASE